MTNFLNELSKSPYFTICDGYKDSLTELKKYEKKYNITSQEFCNNVENENNLEIDLNDKDEWYFYCTVFKICGGKL